MKRVMMALMVVLFCISSNVSYASNWYLEPYIGINNIKYSNFDLMGISTNTSASSSSAALGIAFGYIFPNNLRCDISISGTSSGATIPSDAFKTTRSTFLMSNLYYDFHIDSVFNPYLGAGIGTVFTSYSYDFGFVKNNNYASNLAYRLAIGGITKLDNNLSLDLGYRLTGFTFEADLFKYQGVIFRLKSPVISHELFAGLRIDFGHN